MSEKRFAPNADVYLHIEEENMILGKEKRFSFAGIKLKNPVCFQGKYNLFKDRDIIMIDDIKVECFHIPGHTKGHSAFLVDNTYLFTGDSIATNEFGGYCFFDFYNMDTNQNISSLKKLKEELNNYSNIKVCTSHNGMHDKDYSFSHIDEIVVGTKKKPFDKTAPHDSFDL